MKVTSIGQITDAAWTVFEEVKSGSLTIEQAQQQRAALQVVNKSAEIMLDHAKMSRRIKKGSDTLPDVRFGSRKG